MEYIGCVLLSDKTHQPDQTKLNINKFDMAKSAVQLLYVPVLVCALTLPANIMAIGTSLKETEQTFLSAPYFSLQYQTKKVDIPSQRLLI